MIPENLSQGILYYHAGNGEYVKVGEIQEISLPEIQQPSNAIEFSASIEFSAQGKVRKGAFDCLVGKFYTPAAMRYARLCIRHKEKQRRRRLKYGNT